ncbi:MULTISPECIES: lysophospholipid acyltransferase family protein [unclassified Sphingobium]|uniref:lysophospholipid acyltransferase family protein n=1 Tax=unclassified Sphingobium TaxID=2611147 RepID=UPI000D156EA1|nr:MULTISPECIES: lysophospholipid acyltransferase family protein [unclassified Sphingobium]MBG6118022.1 1-acyl-sn-glycerol-3-phosphate acyltransferase [Sphingobium sp. JAI105]PSO10493.1 1-acyl-sn-glycerol-3-phosphate acyltransferase [Sphingobium sp. AEW4]TWD01116.1 1-acyl-sn-glycerol-3-phosphate acyltransferase [Sphingobium sp. AEW010]TWD19832.1 1-acyl-sn-glycerol-3-phosphate acyltransferase [Sphingobium sp. AEW013]TWD22379.1 1-acyl-sn-glycerol-3-phosphate acyltransferase [Sphingobium sp. AEW0
MITLLRSTLFSLIFYPGSLLLVLVALIVGQFSPPALRWVSTLWGWFHRYCARWLLGQKVVIEGDLPLGPYLYIVKHESMFETIDMLCVFDRPVIAAKRELFDIPLWGTIADRYGLIPIERTAGASAMRTLRTQAKAANAAGRAVCIFPEGTRVPHGEAPPLRAGFAGLYTLLGLPVVPIALNSGLVSPKGSFLKKAGVITYKVGEVVPAGLDRREAEARVHAAINALNPPSALVD